MKRLIYWITSGVFLFTAAFSLHAASPAAKPNIVYILADDLGYGDLRCFNAQSRVPTPHLDQLAAEGTRFTQFYVASPICSPSRVAITTGMYPARWRINSYLQTREGNRHTEQVDFLDLKAPSMARAFKQAGYATGHFGKWHMGGGRDVQDAPLPSAYGFDEHFVNFEGMGPRIPTDGTRDTPEVEGHPLPRNQFTEFWVNKTIDFMRRNKDRPFFVNLWPMDVHDPHQPNAAMTQKYIETPGVVGQRKFYGVLEEFDANSVDCLPHSKNSAWRTTRLWSLPAITDRTRPLNTSAPPVCTARNGACTKEASVNL